MKKLAAVAFVLLTAAVVAAASMLTWGGVSLVSTRGDSMHPGFDSGDLAVLGSASSYAVGDVAAYYSDELGTVVMHRIVAVDGDRYAFKGDNNSWVDSEHPTHDQMLGKLAFRIPGGGVWLDRATAPGTVGAIAFLLLASGGGAAALTRRQRRKKHNLPQPATLPPALRQLTPALRAFGAVVVALTAAALAVGAVAWSRPLTSETTAPTAASHSSTVTFSYRAVVPPSPAYDATIVTEPQPVFRNLVDDVDVEFRYESDILSPAGTARPTVLLSTANGWQSEVQVGPAETFTGTTYTGTMRLVLSELQERANAAADVIGDEPAGDVTVTIAPEISTDDDVVFRPQLPFILTATALRLAGDDPELTVRQTDSVQTLATSRQPARLSVLGGPILIAHLRTGSVVGLSVALLGGVAFAALVRRARRAPEAAAILSRYAHQLLRVAPMALPSGRPVIEVPDIEALVRLAERYGLLVMHWDRGGIHTYVVLDDSTTYRYRPNPTTPPTAAATANMEPVTVEGPTTI